MQQTHTQRLIDIKLNFIFFIYNKYHSTNGKKYDLLILDGNILWRNEILVSLSTCCTKKKE